MNSRRRKMEEIRSSYVGYCSFSLVGLWSNKREAILCCSLCVQLMGEKCDEGGHVRLVETWRTLGRKLPSPPTCILVQGWGIVGEWGGGNRSFAKSRNSIRAKLHWASSLHFIDHEVKVTVLTLSSMEEQCSSNCIAFLYLRDEKNILWKNILESVFKFLQDF